jgi:hypothetical protein
MSCMAVPHPRREGCQYSSRPKEVRPISPHLLWLASSGGEAGVYFRLEMLIAAGHLPLTEHVAVR